MVKLQIKQIEAEVAQLEKQLEEESLKIPNDIHPDVPRDGLFEVLTTKGTRPQFDFEPLPHWEIGKKWDLFDLEKGATAASTGFYYLKNEACLLEMALISWVTQLVSRQHAFRPVATPDVVHFDYAEACGFRPRSHASQIYKIADTELCLVGTSEISIGAMHANSLSYHQDWTKYPIKELGFSHCFRAETSHGGAQARGLYRVHQFSKVEMFVISLPEDSERMHQALLDIQMQIFSALGLHYRVLDMPSNDLGASAFRKFDIEAWFPSRQDYGEISSCSNCTDYQARRLNIRSKDATGSTLYLHTLNGTALAVPRIIMAILENFQLADHSVVIPEVLVPFMGGLTHIGAPSRAS